MVALKFANGDSRYVYIYEENKGLSAARNKGIECAIDFSGGGGMTSFASWTATII